MAFDVGAAHRALADQLRAALGETFDVFAFPELGTLNGPRIEIAPSGSWVSLYGTHGPNGNGDVVVTVRAFLSGFKTSEDRANWAFRLASVGLSVDGNDQTYSLADAVMSDRTLGGVVSDCVPLGPDGEIAWDADDDVIEMPVLMILKKSGATV